MAEFVDVIHHTKRICKSVNGHCEKCLFGAFSCPNNARFDSTDEQKFIDFANAVMTWAAEHPEPVYPSWYEYLTDMYPATWNMIKDKPIPADIAEKLGIEPKEGV